MLDFDVVDILQIESRATVFTGKVVAGEVQVGDSVVLVSSSGQAGFTVKDLEPNGFRRNGAKVGCNVAIISDHLELVSFADGMRWVGDHYEAKSLKIIGGKIVGAA